MAHLFDVQNTTFLIVFCQIKFHKSISYPKIYRYGEGNFFPEGKLMHI